MKLAEIFEAMTDEQLDIVQPAHWAKVNPFKPWRTKEYITAKLDAEKAKRSTLRALPEAVDE